MPESAGTITFTVKGDTSHVDNSVRQTEKKINELKTRAERNVIKLKVDLKELDKDFAPLKNPLIKPRVDVPDLRQQINNAFSQPFTIPIRFDLTAAKQQLQELQSGGGQSQGGFFGHAAHHFSVHHAVRNAIAAHPIVHYRDTTTGRFVPPPPGAPASFNPMTGQPNTGGFFHPRTGRFHPPPPVPVVVTQPIPTQSTGRVFSNPVNAAIWGVGDVAGDIAQPFVADAVGQYIADNAVAGGIGIMGRISSMSPLQVVGGVAAGMGVAALGDVIGGIAGARHGGGVKGAFSGATRGLIGGGVGSIAGGVIGMANPIAGIATSIGIDAAMQSPAVTGFLNEFQHGFFNPEREYMAPTGMRIGQITRNISRGVIGSIFGHKTKIAIPDEAGGFTFTEERQGGLLRGAANIIGAGLEGLDQIGNYSNNLFGEAPGTILGTAQEPARRRRRGGSRDVNNIINQVGGGAGASALGTNVRVQEPLRVFVDNIGSATSTVDTSSLTRSAEQLTGSARLLEAAGHALSSAAEIFHRRGGGGGGQAGEGPIPVPRQPPSPAGGGGEASYPLGLEPPYQNTIPMRDIVAQNQSVMPYEVNLPSRGELLNETYQRALNLSNISFAKTGSYGLKRSSRRKSNNTWIGSKYPHNETYSEPKTFLEGAINATEGVNLSPFTALTHKDIIGDIWSNIYEQQNISSGYRDVARSIPITEPISTTNLDYNRDINSGHPITGVNYSTLYHGFPVQPYKLMSPEDTIRQRLREVPPLPPHHDENAIGGPVIHPDLNNIESDRPYFSRETKSERRNRLSPQGKSMWDAQESVDRASKIENLSWLYQWHSQNRNMSSSGIPDDYKKRRRIGPDDLGRQTPSGASIGSSEFESPGILSYGKAAALSLRYGVQVGAEQVSTALNKLKGAASSVSDSFTKLGSGMGTLFSRMYHGGVPVSGGTGEEVTGAASGGGMGRGSRGGGGGGGTGGTRALRMAHAASEFLGREFGPVGGGALLFGIPQIAERLHEERNREFEYNIAKQFGGRDEQNAAALSGLGSVRHSMLGFLRHEGSNNPLNWRSWGKQGKGNTAWDTAEEKEQALRESIQGINWQDLRRKRQAEDAGRGFEIRTNQSEGSPFEQQRIQLEAKSDSRKRAALEQFTIDLANKEKTGETSQQVRDRYNTVLNDNARLDVSEKAAMGMRVSRDSSISAITSYGNVQMNYAVATGQNLHAINVKKETELGILEGTKNQQFDMSTAAGRAAYEAKKSSINSDAMREQTKYKWETTDIFNAAGVANLRNAGLKREADIRTITDATKAQIERTGGGNEPEAVQRRKSILSKSIEDIQTVNDQFIENLRKMSASTKIAADGLEQFGGSFKAAKDKIEEEFEAASFKASPEETAKAQRHKEVQLQVLQRQEEFATAQSNLNILSLQHQNIVRREQLSGNGVGAAQMEAQFKGEERMKELEARKNAGEFHTNDEYIRLKTAIQQQNYLDKVEAARKVANIPAQAVGSFMGAFHFGPEVGNMPGGAGNPLGPPVPQNLLNKMPKRKPINPNAFGPANPFASAGGDKMNLTDNVITILNEIAKNTGQNRTAVAV